MVPQVKDERRDPRGWVNVCTRRCADGAICGKLYFLAYVPSAGRGKRVELDVTGEPTDAPHTCRQSSTATNFASV